MGIITFRISYDKSVPTTVRKILSKTLTLLKFMEDSTHFALSYVVGMKFLIIIFVISIRKFSFLKVYCCKFLKSIV